MAGYIGNKAVGLNVTTGDILGDVGVGGDLSLGDNNKAIFGDGSDLEIYHDGNSKIADVGAGKLELHSNGTGVFIQKGATEHMAKFLTDGAVELMHNNVKTFETTATGVTVFNPAENAILQINAATANKDSILQFGDAGDADAGLINYDHNNNEMIFSTNAAANTFSMTGTKGFFVYDTFLNWGSSNFDITISRGRYLERMGNMADDAKIRVFVGSYTYHGGSIEYQIRDGGGTQNIVGGGVIYYSAREDEPNATIVGTNTSTKIVVTGAASGDTYTDGKFTFALRATNGDSHITINNRLGSVVNMSLKFNIQYQG